MPIPPRADIPDRIVQIDELFFSTTDRHGVITGANTVFGALSHYTRAELIGAPHNIVRHPEMPGGAFAIMWDRLLTGHPMVAYVKNLASDGSSYWVFATITPLGDGFLSVRGAPCRQDLWDAAWGIYQEVLPLERDAREAGLSKAGAARVGAEAIVAPPWVPYRERIQPGDLSPGDLLPVDDDDPRLVPTYSFGDDPLDADDKAQIRQVAQDLGLGRVRTLSPEGRELAAQRWYDGDGGPDSPLARSAPDSCSAGRGCTRRTAGTWEPSRSRRWTPGSSPPGRSASCVRPNPCSDTR